LVGEEARDGEFALAIATFLVGGAANNIELATQSMRDYIPWLVVALALLVVSVRFTYRLLRRGALGWKLASVLLGVVSVQQLISAGHRLLSILSLG